jgi:hypothetical protein
MAAWGTGNGGDESVRRVSVRRAECNTAAAAGEENAVAIDVVAAPASVTDRQYVQ